MQLYNHIDILQLWHNVILWRRGVFRNICSVFFPLSILQSALASSYCGAYLQFLMNDKIFSKLSNIEYHFSPLSASLCVCVWWRNLYGIKSLRISHTLHFDSIEYKSDPLAQHFPSTSKQVEISKLWCGCNTSLILVNWLLYAVHCLLIFEK